MSWFNRFKAPEPGRVEPPVKPGAKPSRNNPQPNYAPTGKRRRQWR